MAFKQTGKGWNFDQVARKIAAQRQLIKNDIGRQSVNHFVGSFRNQGFTDETLNPWEEVKRRKQGEKAYKYAKKSSRTRGILVESGYLRRAIRVVGTPGEKVIIGTRGIKYAKIHNEGLRGRAFGKYGFKMPQRKFVGNSSKLERQIYKNLTNRLNKIWAQS